MHEPIVIDAETVLRALDECVAERGADYVYKPPGAEIGNSARCLYWHDDENTPGCIVGLALYNLGVPADRITRLSLAAYPALADLAFEDVITITPLAKRLFAIAQSHQDSGTPWGEVAAIVRQVYEEDKKHNVEVE